MRYIAGNHDGGLEARLASSPGNWHAQYLEWTTDTPKETGWYWVRITDKYQAAWAGRIELIQVAIWEDKITYSLHGFYEITHWLGPLPFPEPPKE